MTILREAKRKIRQYLRANEKRLDYPEIFSFDQPGATPQKPFRWVKSKTDLAELLLALNADRAFRTPDGMIPTYTQLLSGFGEFLDMNIGESGNMSRRVRERDEKAKYLSLLVHTVEDLK